LSEVLTNPYRYVAVSDYPDGRGSDCDLAITGTGVLYQQAGGGSETYSIRFQGVGYTGIGQYSLVSGIDLSSGFTISVWVNEQAFAGAGSTSMFFQVLDGISGTLQSTLYKDIRSEGLHGNLYTSVISLSTWYHVVVTNDGSNSAIWLNGVKDDTDTGSVPDNTSMALGLSTGGTFPTDAFISQWLLYSRELTDAEIATLYNSGSGAAPTSVDTTGLRVYYNFEQSSSPITNIAIP